MAQLRMHFSALSTLSCTDWRNGNWHDGDLRQAERHNALARGLSRYRAREGNRFPDRPRFMGYAARVMRGLIIDHARSRNAIKRGGESKLLRSKPTKARILSMPKNSRRSAMHWINWRKLSLSWLNWST